LVGASVYSTNQTAAAAVTGIYQTMAGNTVGGNFYGISALLGLSADEFTLYPNSDPILNQTYTNALLSSTPIPFWSQLYNCIYQANSAIDGLSAYSGVTSAMKQQLIGETKFIRAFCYFYLVNIFGDVPLITTTDYKQNSIVTRSPESKVYEQIINDLVDAKSLLSNNFLAPDGTPSSARVRPNSIAASALLARVYLYQRKWDSAEAAASVIIDNPNLKLAGNLNSVFLANTEEAIWQLEMPNNGFNAPDGAFLLSLLYYGGPNAYDPFILNNSLVNQFEPGDLRKSNWIKSATVGAVTYYYPYKYKLYYTGTAPTEYPVLLRLAEQYLIRAEARAQQNNLNGALSDLNIIRARAGVPTIATSSQSELINSIYRERGLELFTEYGHRWLDLKRTSNLSAIMANVTPQKGGIWNPTDQLYPIPLTDIQSDVNLLQNPGYN